MSGYTAEMTELYTAEPETEPHIVIAKDKTVIVPEELRAIATQFEKNIETVTFDCPRYWDEHDLSTMRMYINFRRADGVELPHLCGVPTVDEADENIVHFDWTVGNDATAIKGKLSFVAVAKKADENGVLENRWGSRLCQDMEILEGIEPNYAEILEPSADIIEQILYKLDTAAAVAVDAAERATDAAARAVDAADNTVKKTGDTMTGNLFIQKSNSVTVAFVPDNSGVMIQAYSDWNKRKFLSIPSDVASVGYEDLCFVDLDKTSGKNGWFVVHHRRNKPSGSYTGNGEAAARTIVTGGIGNCCVVYGGTDHVAYLTPKGAFFQSGGTMAFTSDVSFSNGVITLRNAYIINTANTTYNYQVL